MIRLNDVICNVINSKNCIKKKINFIYPADECWCIVSYKLNLILSWSTEMRAWWWWKVNHFVRKYSKKKTKTKIKNISIRICAIVESFTSTAFHWEYFDCCRNCCSRSSLSISIKCRHFYSKCYIDAWWKWIKCIS